MRNGAVLIAVVSWLSFPLSAQAPSSAAHPSDKRAEPLTVSGCVSPKPANGNFTFTAKDGTKYRLDGKNLKKYAGQEVELVGGEGKKLTVKGGLVPSPNAAAQAGAIDPGQAMAASQSEGKAAGAGGAELPVFMVNSVRGLSRSCQ